MIAFELMAKPGHGSSHNMYQCPYAWRRPIVWILVRTGRNGDENGEVSPLRGGWTEDC